MVTSGPVASVQSVQRALLPLELLAQGGRRLPATELAGRSGLSLGTVHRLPATLVGRGWVRRQPVSAATGARQRRYATVRPAVSPDHRLSKENTA